MLVWWTANGEPHFASMDPSQHIAYISDVGAQELKPLFIAGSAVTVVCFDSVFLVEKWLRHKGRLAPHTSKSEKIFSILSAIFSIVGAAGLILLSIFDTLRYPHVHDAMLCVFIAGYLLTALFVCCEYQRLGIHQRQYRVLRASFWLKLGWILIFLGLAIGKFLYPSIQSTCANLSLQLSVSRTSATCTTLPPSLSGLSPSSLLSSSFHSPLTSCPPSRPDTTTIDLPLGVISRKEIATSLVDQSMVLKTAALAATALSRTTNHIQAATFDHQAVVET